MLTSTLPRWDGDSEPRFVLDLAKHMRKDFEVEILAPHAPGAARSEILEGVPVTRFRYWIPRWQSVTYEGGMAWRLRENPLRLFQAPYFLCSLAWHLVRRLRRGPRIDLVHAHWIIPQGLVAVLVRGSARRRVPVVCTSHGGDLFGIRGAGWRMLKRMVLRDCDAVTVVSRAMADAVRAITDKVDPIVIPMGTELTGAFVPPPERRPGSISNLVVVGRLVEKKGVRYLLEAIALVVQKHPDIHLKIIGHGPLRPGLESEVQRLGLGKFVTFLGPVPHQQLPVHYQAAEIAVFPFVEAASGDQEGFGLVMVEAMGCGCAVIATDLPAIRDVVQNGRTGLVVAQRDGAALAAAIESLIANPTAALRMANMARAHAMQRFDWAVIAAKYGNIYRALIEGNTR